MLLLDIFFINLQDEIKKLSIAGISPKEKDEIDAIDKIEEQKAKEIVSHTTY